MGETRRQCLAPFFHVVSLIEDRRSRGSARVEPLVLGEIREQCIGLIGSAMASKNGLVYRLCFQHSPAFQFLHFPTPLYATL